MSERFGGGALLPESLSLAFGPLSKNAYLQRGASRHANRIRTAAGVFPEGPAGPFRVCRDAYRACRHWMTSGCTSSDRGVSH